MNNIMLYSSFILSINLFNGLNDGLISADTNIVKIKGIIPHNPRTDFPDIEGIDTLVK